MSQKQSKRIALFPGSFDPFTLGHLNLVERVANLFDEIVIVVADSRAKAYLFSATERVALAQRVLAKHAPALKNVRVERHDGLTIDFAQQIGASVILRGLRSHTDFEHEMILAHSNYSQCRTIETMLVYTLPEFSWIASRIVKELVTAGGDVSKMVPPTIAMALKEKLQSSKPKRKV